VNPTIGCLIFIQRSLRTAFVVLEKCAPSSPSKVARLKQLSPKASRYISLAASFYLIVSI